MSLARGGRVASKGMTHATHRGAKRLRFRLLAAAALLVGPSAIGVAGTPPVPRSSEISSGQSDIYTVRLDGTGLRRLTHAPADIRYDSPAWSRSGRWIAFSGPPCDDCPEAIFLVDLARSGRTRRLAGTVLGASRPSWGPSDHALTFVGGLTNSVFTIGRQGTGQRRLTNKRIAHDQSAWSPDGRRILFTTQQTNGQWDIFVMRSDGSLKTNLTATAVSEEQPAWSHDGSKIAFARQIGGNWAIFVQPAGGGPARRLTPLTQNSQQPAWSPGDGRIAYTLLTSRGSRIVITGADGTGTRTLRTGNGSASAPSWSPDGRRIAFTRSG